MRRFGVHSSRFAVHGSPFSVGHLLVAGTREVSREFLEFGDAIGRERRTANREL